MILLYVIEKNLRARTFENSEYVLMKSFQLNKIIITLHQELVLSYNNLLFCFNVKIYTVNNCHLLTTNAILGRAKCDIPLLL
jgi:hypothetical protein